MLGFLDDFDAILSPVFPGPARLHGTMNPPGKIDPTSFITPQPHRLAGGERPAAR